MNCKRVKLSKLLKHKYTMQKNNNQTKCVLKADKLPINAN